MSGCSVIIVDDDNAVRDSLESLLEAADYATESYPSGMAFLDACRDPGNACVLLDAMMPKMDGFKVLQALQRSEPCPPVIIMTGNGEVETAARAIRSGAIGFLQKPFVEEELFDSVEHALSIAGDPGYRVAATKAAQQNLEGLTQRERQVLELLVTGRSNVEVAGELNCNLHTAEIYRARVMQKTGADSLWQLMRIALLAGVLIAE